MLFSWVISQVLSAVFLTIYNWWPVFCDVFHICESCWKMLKVRWKFVKYSYETSRKLSDEVKKAKFRDRRGRGGGGGWQTVDQNLPRYSSNAFNCFFDKQKNYKMLDKKGELFVKDIVWSVKTARKSSENRLRGEQFMLGNRMYSRANLPIGSLRCIRYCA